MIVRLYLDQIKPKIGGYEMGTFRIVTRNELRTRKKLSKEDVLLFDQFKEYLAKLGNKEAGVYEFSKDEDQEKCMKMLRKAARALETRIRISQEGNSMV